MLKLTDVYAGYGGGDVLQGVELDVPVGSVCCIVGPNGAGKSTVLRAVSGLLQPRKGDVQLEGESLCGLHPRASSRWASHRCRSRTRCSRA